MAKLEREAIIKEALALLDDVGLDAVSTRRLAQRLGVEQPSLYWHFRSKAALLDAMAEAALAPLATEPLPAPGDDWRAWFLENFRSLRRTLLLHRDGARLHAGTTPQSDGFARALRKFDFLVSAGLPADQTRAALLTAGQFTVGSVLEEQAAAARPAADGPGPAADGPGSDPAAAFDAGVLLIIDGLARPAGDRGASRSGR
jgi:TetR/AcrR family transcriptional regulator, tetracycline repressor protein